MYSKNNHANCSRPNVKYLYAAWKMTAKEGEIFKCNDSMYQNPSLNRFALSLQKDHIVIPPRPTIAPTQENLNGTPEQNMAQQSSSSISTESYSNEKNANVANTSASSLPSLNISQQSNSRTWADVVKFGKTGVTPSPKS